MIYILICVVITLSSLSFGFFLLSELTRDDLASFEVLVHKSDLIGVLLL